MPLVLNFFFFFFSHQELGPIAKPNCFNFGVALGFKHSIYNAPKRIQVLVQYGIDTDIDTEIQYFLKILRYDTSRYIN